MAAPPRRRLDQTCAELGLAPSRERAQALILAGEVLVDGEVVRRAGVRVPEGARVELRHPDEGFVSRGGIKLEAALSAFGIDVTGLAALDVGASTGGFTDCLLRRGARRVVALDVGYGQLAWKLRTDPRVTVVERCNARHLDPAALRLVALAGDPERGWPLEIATVDVSFISLALVLPAIVRVLGPGRSIVALVKPQFEAGREEVGKGGVVRDPATRRRAIDRVLSFARDSGLAVLGEVDSPIAGPKGNVEALVHLRT
jgi:23S rRNA (cytidine1920-2'-O)/16S rRNA (cytidine1409-2'-O)-methyltransferase